MSERWVWLSDRFVAEAEASVPVTSRSVRLGVGVYDTLRVTHGRAPLLERHLVRLESGARACGVWPGPRDWEGVLAELVRRNCIEEGFARITLGDGFALVSLAPLPPELEAQRSAGFRLRTETLERPLASLKGLSRLDLEIAEQRAGGEVLLVGADGRALETTRANFFAVTEAGLETAALPSVLPGVARALLMEIAAGEALAVREVAPRLSEIARWREAFTSSAPRGIRPVVAIDGHVLSSGRPGPLALHLQRALDARCGLGA